MLGQLKSGTGFELCLLELQMLGELEDVEVFRSGSLGRELDENLIEQLLVVLALDGGDELVCRVW